MSDEAVSDPYDSQPLSEIYRVVSKKWVDADAAAQLLEETKSHVLQFEAQKLIDADGLTGAEAERRVKGSPFWRDWVTAMVEARKKALTLKCQLEFIRMRAAERASAEATRRHEMRL